MHDPRISALLRLKRFEQPPPGYFDDLLTEVHRRQRTELLQRSLWKIALERVQVFFGEHSMGGLTYAGSMAAALVVGIAAIGFMTQDEIGTGSGAPTIAESGGGPIEQAPELGGVNRMLVVAPQTAAALAPQPAEDAALAASPPRYVIDARPVSYEPAFSF